MRVAIRKHSDYQDDGRRLGLLWTNITRPCCSAKSASGAFTPWPSRPAPRAISTAPLDCTSCYYLSKEKLLNAQAKDSMDDMTLERFVEQYIEAVTGDSVVFTWQGGEPTLLGLQFFHKVVAFQKNMRSQRRKSRTIYRPTDIDNRGMVRVLESQSLLGRAEH